MAKVPPYIPPDIFPSAKYCKPWGRLETVAGVLGYTMHSTILVRDAFQALRLHVQNAGTTAITGVKVAVAVSTNNTTACIPTGAWTQCSLGGNTSITLPAAINAYRVVDVALDPVNMASVDRSDGSYYLVHVRMYVPASGNTVAGRVPAADDLLSGSTIDIAAIQGGAAAGDYVTTNQAAFPRTIKTLAAPIWLECFTGNPLSKRPLLANFGDSTSQGLGWASTHGQIGAATLVTTQMGIAHFNQGFASAPADDYMYNAELYMQTIRPQIAICAPWSTNDSDAYTSGVSEKVVGRASRFVEMCQRYGAIPILSDPHPKNGITSGQETVRRGVVTDLAAWASARNIALLSRDAVYTDYTVATGGYKAGYTDDGIHPNSTSYPIEAAALKPLVSAALTKRAAVFTP